jgi:hypothetical protein
MAVGKERGRKGGEGRRAGEKEREREKHVPVTYFL